MAEYTGTPNVMASGGKDKSHLTTITAWTLFNSRFGLACADLETRSVRAIEAAQLENVELEGRKMHQDSHR